MSAQPNDEGLIERYPLPDVETEQTSRPVRRRIDSIDLLRGIVMVVMMLDHTRDFVHSATVQFDPLDLTHTNPALFFTRWITHYCAPVFVFLAGTGAYLQFARGKSKRDLSLFLLTRGLWLIVLELTVVRLGASFNFDFRFFGALQVIWVLGVSMIVLAALIHLPLRVIAAFGVLMIALHNLLDKVRVAGWRGPGSPVPGFGAKLWIILHQPFEAFPIVGFPSPIVFVLYNVIPWVAVMAAGYAFGSVYQMEPAVRRRRLLFLGGLATALFFVIRGINVYGDANRWTGQKSLVFTVLSFLNTTKYPPSLLFLLMTLGPAIILLAWFEPLKASQANTAGSSRLRSFFVIFGRVPLFFYILQWFTAHAIAVLLHLAFGKPVRWLFQSPMDWFNGPPRDVGFNLAIVYVAWIAGVLLLYPLCWWFAGVKARRSDWWLSYL